MLIAEQLLLLALDPLTGDWRDRTAADQSVLTAALLLELVVLGDLRWQEGRLLLQPGPPNYHLLVQDARRRLQRVTPATAEQLLGNRHIAPRGLLTQLLRGLAARDVLHRDGKRRFGWFGAKRYPVRSMQARQDAMRSLEKALGTGESAEGLALLVLLQASGLDRALLTPQLAAQARQQLSQWEADMANGALAAERAQRLRTMTAIGVALTNRCHR